MGWRQPSPDCAREPRFRLILQKEICKVVFGVSLVFGRANSRSNVETVHKRQKTTAHDRGSKSKAGTSSHTDASRDCDTPIAQNNIPSRKRAVRDSTAQNSSKSAESEQIRLELLARARAAKVAKVAGRRRSRSPSEQRQDNQGKKRQRDPAPAAQIEVGRPTIHRTVRDLYDVHDRGMRAKKRRVLTRRETAEKTKDTEDSSE